MITREQIEQLGQLSQNVNPDKHYWFFRTMGGHCFQRFYSHWIWWNHDERPEEHSGTRRYGTSIPEDQTTWDEQGDDRYADAIAAYKEIKNTKKPGKKDIDKQFEYNTYVRDFFDDNKGASLADAIKCWKYKKSIKGHNRYERSDLRALEQ